MNKLLRAFEKIVEYSTGRKANDLRNETIDEKRRLLNKRGLKEKVIPITKYVLTHESVEKMLKDSLKYYRALASDWKAIGDDFRKVINF